MMEMIFFGANIYFGMIRSEFEIIAS